MGLVGHREKTVMLKLGRYEEAIQRIGTASVIRTTLQLIPATQFCNEYAWFLATCPNSKYVDAPKAVELAEKAVKLSPKDGTFLSTLGVAQYRAGEWQAAIEALEKSMELREGGDASDWFFLAMAHWQLGHKDEARKWYDKAVEWMDKNQPKNEELLRFRAEAAELLGISEPAKSTDAATKP